MYACPKYEISWGVLDTSMNPDTFQLRAETKNYQNLIRNKKIADTKISGYVNGRSLNRGEL